VKLICKVFSFMLAVFLWLRKKDRTVAQIHLKKLGVETGVFKFYKEFCFRFLYSFLGKLRLEACELPQNAIITTAHFAFLPALLRLRAYFPNHNFSLIVRYPRVRLLKLLYVQISKLLNVNFVFRFKDFIVQPNQCLVVFLDQDTKGVGIFTEFCGEKAKTSSTIFKLALEQQRRAFFLGGYLKDSIFRLSIKPLQGASVSELCLAYNKALESCLREDFFSWPWFHKRWRTRDNKKLSYEEYISFVNSHSFKLRLFEPYSESQEIRKSRQLS